MDGRSNAIYDNSYRSFIGTGWYNTIYLDSYYSSIVGGLSQSINEGGRYDFIGGGNGNLINYSQYSSIVGGKDNTLNSTGDYNAILGGTGNTLGGAYEDTFIIGSGITADASNTTFVEGLKASGNVTLGNGANLTIDDGDYIYVGSSTDNSIRGSLNDIYIATADDLFLDPTDDVVVRVGTTAYVTFDGSAQSVGIGSTTPAQKLDVHPNEDESAQIGKAHVGHVGFDGYAGFSHVDMDSTTNYSLIQHSEGNTYLNAASGKHIYFRINNANSPNAMELNNEGGFGVAATPATTAGHIRAANDIVAYYSDERLKEKINIGIKNPIEKIMNINVFTYKHNKLANSLGFEGDKIHIGVGAHSVKESLPEAVEVAPFDANEDGSSKSGEDYLTVQYERLVPLLIEGIKDQQKQINELKQQVKEIKDAVSK